MYLARRRIAGRWQYALRESYRSGAHLLFREVFDLGPAPERFIVYPGGNAFYIDPELEEALRARGADPSSAELESIFWPFIAPDIRWKLEGFRCREERARRARETPDPGSPDVPHLFDRRRLLFLKTGRLDQRSLGAAAALQPARAPGQVARRARAGVYRDGGRAPTAGAEGVRLHDLRPAAGLRPALRP